MTKSLLNKLIDICNTIPMFNYKKVKYNNVNVYSFHYTFKNLGDLKKNKIHRELRGLAVIEYNNSIEIYPSVPSFDTFNTYEGTLLKNLENKKIVYLTEKSDGSLIIPFKVNNTIHYKTGRSFDNSVLTNMYNEITDINNYNNFINEMYKLNYYPLFEYVSPNNKILVDYSAPELRLIMVRYIPDINKPLSVQNIDFHNNKEIMNLVNEYSIKTTNRYNNFNNMPFKNLYTDITTNTNSNLYTLFNSNNFEGFVVMFEDGTLIKLKTQWFLSSHYKFDMRARLLNTPEKRKDTFTYLLLNDKLDELPYDLLEEYNNEISNIEQDINKTIENTYNIIIDMKEQLHTKEMKELAPYILKEKYSHTIFKLIKSNTIIDREIVYNEIKKEMLKNLNNSTLKFFSSL